MSFRKINELRHEGRLEEAKAMADEALEKDADNIWNKRAASWVNYEYLKKFSQPEDYLAFKENLLKIQNLQLPEDDKMVFDKSAWQIGSIVFKLQKQENVDYGKIDELFEIIKDFQFTKPSEGYTFIYKAFHKGYKNWSNYLTFADWWNFENFRSVDFLKEEFNERKIMAIAEQAYIAYSKKLLEEIKYSNDNEKSSNHLNDKVDIYIEELNSIIESRPNYTYLPYYKAKLLMENGDDEILSSSFLSFAQEKVNEFWLWDLMADIYYEDQNVQFAYFCKALSLKTKEGFLVKLREKFSKLLIHFNMLSEAKAEIKLAIEAREKNGWNLTNNLKKWMNEDWYINTQENNGNQKLYAKYADKAENLIYKNLPERLIAIEFVNTNKKIANYIIDKDNHGFFKYEGKIKSPKVGEIYYVRFRNETNGHNFIYTAKKAKDEAVLKEISGIGPKTAQRLILELQNKLEDFAYLQNKNNQFGAAGAAADKDRQDVIDALTALGYKISEINRALREVEFKDELNVSEKIKITLSQLGKER